ncbi:uncharacterized protein LOC127902270 [Citrus sinensis]|uniref:uncharacterized protein LOC127902270 n=1 Tax=Citrus sinensis TaxID=2711 RepID=UPI002279A300|nr:uncharacterized protein LOC127902270 [Citrus sinensis]
MEKHVLMKLCQVLSESYGLKRGNNISIIESVAMFFITLGHAFGNRMVQEIFQHSGKYYLVDARYPHITGYLDPYKGGDIIF